MFQKGDKIIVLTRKQYTRNNNQTVIMNLFRYAALEREKYQRGDVLTIKKYTDVGASYHLYFTDGKVGPWYLSKKDIDKVNFIKVNYTTFEHD